MTLGARPHTLHHRLPPLWVTLVALPLLASRQHPPTHRAFRAPPHACSPNTIDFKIRKAQWLQIRSEQRYLHSAGRDGMGRRGRALMLGGCVAAPACRASACALGGCTTAPACHASACSLGGCTTAPSLPPPHLAGLVCYLGPPGHIMW